MSWRFALLLVAMGLVVACGVRPRTHVEQTPAQARRSTPAAPVRTAAPVTGSYQVVRGDTLYGIAFRHGLDYRDLARWNGIQSPYTIYPGQRLRLSGQTAAAPVVASQPTASPSPTNPGAVAAASPAVPTQTGSATTSVTTGSTPQPTTTPAPVASTPTPPVAVASTPVVAATPTTTPPAAASTSPAASRIVQNIQWRWPASGQIIARFTPGDQTRQGIGIAGQSGDKVVAAAAGEVVYSGAGLLGYGELVIIKHSSDFLSAYGHNRKRLVNEGEKVQAGQQIAEMGRTGASRDMLHFEIRKSGKPVDPLGYLPPR